MARVHTVKHAQKAGLVCGSCREPILPSRTEDGKRILGDPYRWAAPRSSRASSGYKKVRCMKPQCGFRPSDLTSSPHKGALYDAVDDAQRAIESAESYEDLESALSECGGAVREVAEALRESATNIEEGFGHETYQSQELTERADALDEWADALEDKASEFGSEDENERTCVICGETATEHEEAEEAAKEIDATAPDHEYEADALDTSEAEDVLGENPE